MKELIKIVLPSNLNPSLRSLCDKEFYTEKDWPKLDTGV
jgi:hypothetical protein